MSRNKRLPPECVYCGATEDLTRDHVPGRGLFLPPRPDNLITVPCCKPHNKEYQLEDEYFRLYVASRVESATHPEAAWGREKAFAGLLRPESAGFDSTFR